MTYSRNLSLFTRYLNHYNKFFIFFLHNIGISGKKIIFDNQISNVNKTLVSKKEP